MEQQQMPEGATVARYREEQIRENFGSPSEFLETMEHGDARKLPEVAFRAGQKVLFNSTHSNAARDSKINVEVEIVRRLTDQEADLSEVGPMFKIRFADGHIEDAFVDELAPREPWEGGVPGDIPGNSKLSYVELSCSGKGVVGKAMMCLDTGSVFNVLPVGDALPSEIEQASEIRQPSSGRTAAIKSAVDGRFQLVNLAELTGFDGNVAPRKLQEPRNSPEDSIGMTDVEVVEGAERMARVLLKAWGFEFSGEAVRKSGNPRAISAWNVVSAMLEEYNGTDLSSAVDSVDCDVHEVSQPDLATQALTPDPLQMLRNALRFNELGKRHESAEAISAAIGVLERK
ncbi:hypothetical protein [Burkholderia vietnamiensis]|uniref:hypothetical protein n=1 Tax=Burkholderia vietnamiensis TaxID=60552 RepID=UPI001FC87B9A|nr:hypothetical protein [Burkholderia vietnamiensis]